MFLFKNNPSDSVIGSLIPVAVTWTEALTGHVWRVGVLCIHAWCVLRTEAAALRPGVQGLLVRG